MNFISSQCCQQKNHENNLIIGYCRNQNCTNYRWFCSRCSQEIHKDHQLDQIQFPELQEWMNQKSRSYEIIFSFISEITEVQKLIANFVNPLLANPEQNILNMKSQELEKKIYKLSQIENCERKLIKLIAEASKLLQQIKEESQSLFQLDQKLENYEQNNKQSENLFRFSHPLKHQDIHIENNGKLAQGNYYVACQPVIQKQGITQLSLRFSGQNIFIGLCHRELINQVTYSTEKLNNIGHGAYLIRNNGYVYSNLQKELNCTKHKFQFKSGEVIVIKIDMDEKKVDWINLDNQKQLFSMKLDTSRDLYVFAHLFNCYVEILQDSL